MPFGGPHGPQNEDEVKEGKRSCINSTVHHLKHSILGVDCISCLFMYFLSGNIHTDIYVTDVPEFMRWAGVFP